MWYKFSAKNLITFWKNADRQWAVWYVWNGPNYIRKYNICCKLSGTSCLNARLLTNSRNYFFLIWFLTFFHKHTSRWNKIKTHNLVNCWTLLCCSGRLTTRNWLVTNPIAAVIVQTIGDKTSQRSDMTWKIHVALELDMTRRDGGATIDDRPTAGSAEHGGTNRMGTHATNRREMDRSGNFLLFKSNTKCQNLF